MVNQEQQRHCDEVADGREGGHEVEGAHRFDVDDHLQMFVFDIDFLKLDFIISDLVFSSQVTGRNLPVLPPVDHVEEAEDHPAGKVQPLHGQKHGNCLNEAWGKGRGYNDGRAGNIHSRTIHSRPYISVIPNPKHKYQNKIYL
jgi:hypothetical protein